MQLPLNFESSAKATSGTKTAWRVQSGSHEAECAVPPEFGGSGEGFSPEDFFAQALVNCFVGTFKVYAEASKVSFKELKVNATLTVDKNDQGQTVMSRCHLNIFINGAEQPDRVKTLVAKTLRSGFILNSVKTDLTHHLEISEGAS
jgi:organic hydroperoxide reductase OsmC/OhrA